MWLLCDIDNYPHRVIGTLLHLYSIIFVISITLGIQLISLCVVLLVLICLIVYTQQEQRYKISYLTSIATILLFRDLEEHLFLLVKSI